MRADVAIIGGGVIGTAIARQLCRYRLNLVLIEKGSDVGEGTSKANSGIVHAGYDPVPGTLKARFNLAGNSLMATMAAELDVPVIEEGGDGQMATCASSTVAGLDPRGDGFLAVRSGPGSQYRKIGELHNGDVVYEFDRKGDWAGIVWGESSVNCSSTTTRESRSVAGWWPKGPSTGGSG